MQVFLAVLFVAFLTFESALCSLVCTGTPPTYDGKACATTTTNTTNYKGECECGPVNTGDRFDWVSYGQTVGASYHYFDNNGSPYCGSRCGKCVKLTTTGGFVDGDGSIHTAGQSHYFMITDSCHDSKYCTESPNDFGYEAHFEFNDENSQVSVVLSWDNPEVTYELVDCADSEDFETPTSSDYEECTC